VAGVCRQKGQIGVQARGGDQQIQVPDELIALAEPGALLPEEAADR
jgi:hypothetical protein